MAVYSNQGQTAYLVIVASAVLLSLIALFTNGWTIFKTDIVTDYDGFTRGLHIGRPIPSIFQHLTGAGFQDLTREITMEVGLFKTEVCGGNAGSNVCETINRVGKHGLESWESAVLYLILAATTIGCIALTWGLSLCCCHKTCTMGRIMMPVLALVAAILHIGGCVLYAIKAFEDARQPPMDDIFHKLGYSWYVASALSGVSWISAFVVGIPARQPAFEMPTFNEISDNK